MLDIIHGDTAYPQIASALAETFQSTPSDGTFYIGYPILSSADEKVNVDGLLITREHGIIAFVITCQFVCPLKQS